MAPVIPNPFQMPQSNDSGYGGASPTSSSDSSDDSVKIDDQLDLEPINVREDIGLSDQDLVLMDTKDLNKLLKKRNVPNERRKEIKQQRRTLKNRGYASNCRDKREQEEKTLEKKNDALRELIYKNKLDIEQAKQETQDLLKKYYKKEEELKSLQQEYERLTKAEEAGPGLQALLANRSDIRWEKINE